MKSALLIRHTKSDWNSMPEDFDRPIRENRKDDARVIAKEIHKRGFKPDHIGASPAKRTLQTAKIMDHLKSLDKKIKNAVVICHNPSITDFVNRYSDTMIDNMPTTGAVLITFDSADWPSIKDGRLQWFLKHKELRK